MANKKPYKGKKRKNPGCLDKANEAKRRKKLQMQMNKPDESADTEATSSHPDTSIYFEAPLFSIKTLPTEDISFHQDEPDSDIVNNAEDTKVTAKTDASSSQPDTSIYLEGPFSSIKTLPTGDLSLHQDAPNNAEDRKVNIVIYNNISSSTVSVAVQTDFQCFCKDISGKSFSASSSEGTDVAIKQQPSTSPRPSISFTSTNSSRKRTFEVALTVNEEDPLTLPEVDTSDIFIKTELPEEDLVIKWREADDINYEC